MFSLRKKQKTSQAGANGGQQAGVMQRLMGGAEGVTQARGIDLEPRGRQIAPGVFPAPRIIPSAAITNGVITRNSTAPVLVSDSFRAQMHFHQCANTPYQEITRTASVTTNAPLGLVLNATDFSDDLFGGRMDIGMVPYVLVRLSNGSLDPQIDATLELNADFLTTEQGWSALVVDDNTIAQNSRDSVFFSALPNSSVLSQTIRVTQVKSGVAVWILIMPGRPLFNGTGVGRAYLSPLVIRRFARATLSGPGVVGDSFAGSNMIFEDSTVLQLITTVHSAIGANPVGATLTFGSDAVAGLSTVAKAILTGGVRAQLTGSTAYDPFGNVDPSMMG